MRYPYFVLVREKIKTANLVAVCADRVLPTVGKDCRYFS